jgi:hypothetical protein
LWTASSMVWERSPLVNSGGRRSKDVQVAFPDCLCRWRKAPSVVRWGMWDGRMELRMVVERATEVMKAAEECVQADRRPTPPSLRGSGA